MTIKKRISNCFVISLVLLMAMMLFPFSIHADDGENSYTLNSGISITLPEAYREFAVWNQMAEDTPGISKMGFPNYETAISAMKQDGIELITYRDDVDQSFGYAVMIDSYEEPTELTTDSLLSSFCKHNQAICPSIADASVLAYGNIQIKGLSLFKVYFEFEDNLYEHMYAYLLPTSNGIVYEILFRNHNDKTDVDYLDNLVYDSMSKVELSDELSNSLITLDDGSFHIVNGYHRALFDYESSEIEPTSYNKEQSSSAPTVIEKTPYQKFVSFEFPIWIIGIVLMATLFVGVKFSKKGEWQEKPLSLENSKTIQGFAAVLIIIHHLAQELMAKAGVLSAFSELGVLFVGIFFFFSGYGLYTSLKTKENYLKGFLKKRLVTILVPFYVCILVFIMSACMKGQSFSLLDVIASISGWFLINDHMWYIVEIAILYIAFFVIYSLIKNRKAATCVMALFVIALTTGSLLLAHGPDMICRYWFMGEWWYNTTFTFIIGIIVSQNEEKIRNVARKFYVLLLPLFAGLTVGFYFLTNYALNTWSYWNEFPGHPGYKEKFLCLIVQLPWVIFFVITILLIMMKVKFSNPVLKFLGSISLELYLIHRLFLNGLYDGSIMKISSSSLYILLTLLLSVGLATLINGLDKYIVGLINGKIKCEEKDEGRIHSIDTLRIVMAFLVVTIHIPFNGTTGNIFITYGKVAVPFFLVVCGYLLYRDSPDEMMPRLKKQTIRMLIFYIGSNILYFLAMTLSAHIDGHSLYYTSKQYLDFLLYNMSPFSEHLWFFGSLLYALIILMILNKFKLVNKAMFVSPLLIATYVILSHLNVAEAYVLRNVILVGLPYTMMGMLIRRYENELTKIKNPILWILALVLCVTAIIELNIYPQGVGVPYISCEILVYVVVLLCLKYPSFGKGTLAEKMGVELSLPIYILHAIPIIFIFNIIPANVGLICNYGAITIFVVTALFAALYKAIKKIVKKKLVKQVQ